VDEWLPILTLLGGIITGVFGGVGVERYRAQRKDLDHRRDHCHRFLTAADAWVEAEGQGYGQGMEGAEREMTYHRQGLEVFGNRRVTKAMAELEGTMGDPDADYPAARERVVDAMNRDVGPRRWIFFRT
jgi:hypothetical protein